MKHKLKKSWIWDDTINSFMLQKSQGYTLNLCSGNSPVGDVRVDLDKENDPDVVADMRCLPFGDAVFDTVLWDPPWKIGYYQRMKPFFECVRVCKPNGLVIVNSYWIPHSKQVELEELWVRQDSEWSNASIIAVFRKMPGQQTLKEVDS